jgi:hypothetical protein
MKINFIFTRAENDFENAKSFDIVEKKDQEQQTNESLLGINDEDSSKRVLIQSNQQNLISNEAILKDKIPIENVL